MMAFTRSVLMRVLCAAAVAAVMLPLGSILFPYVSDAVNGSQFRLLEAVFSAGMGYGIYALIVA